ncbi:hypothetical protein APR12_000131 [Nocardia amikacinitolerans]|uniref:hypothetical protein n=1 Tax=Nocardia amikacinitolerans TaxID=756689 RepID=UPI00082D30CD|nr:hypothetical protein [Nocardia amikacinitolerans]MCP2314801.1 hypothetical protein [Nocardia amikacinitolerans]
MVTATIVLAILGFVRRWFRRDSAGSGAEGQARRPLRLDTAALRRLGTGTLRFGRDGTLRHSGGDGAPRRLGRKEALRRLARNVIQRPVPALSAAVALLGVAVATSAIAQC